MAVGSVRLGHKPRLFVYGPRRDSDGLPRPHHSWGQAHPLATKAGLSLHEGGPDLPGPPWFLQQVGGGGLRARTKQEPLFEWLLNGLECLVCYRCAAREPVALKLYVSSVFLAEREGFEPPVSSHPHLISSQAHSTTLPSLQDGHSIRSRGGIQPEPSRGGPDWLLPPGRVGGKLKGIRWELP